LTANSQWDLIGDIDHPAAIAANLSGGCVHRTQRRRARDARHIPTKTPSLRETRRWKAPVPAMSQNIRKLIGTAVMAVFVIVYALLAMLLGATFVSNASTLVQTIFYGIAGLAWIVPAGMLIRWMARPDPDFQ
jgi:hypothetical protein